MALDIFSNFDENNKNIFSSMILLMWIPIFLTPPLKYFKTTSNRNSFMLMWKSIIFKIISRSMSKSMGMSYSIFLSWSLIVMWMNILGLMPYIFSLTSHLAINLSLALPMWMTIILLNMSYNIDSYVSHFQPLGSPTLLNPFLCLIELVSTLVQPMTLAVRITANLSTGHIMLALMGGAFASSNFMLMSILLLVGIFYIMFDLGVCVIQTYIFTLLPILYTDNHPTQ
uniref:ATP synthase subunit a n=1 Tax=Watersipora subtorquata TaxID=193294 RepID=C4MEG1_9BILA|nr:ATP synthase F0 subunit 6 [Watersipora subtorquata]ABY55229.1 ATP synthase F0 subunit 6 [Watersipora subtorquata]